MPCKSVYTPSCITTSYNTYTGPQHASILYPAEAAIAYRPASQLIMSTPRYVNHTSYHPQLSSATSTTASNSLHHLTHLPSHSTHFQYLPQSTQHGSAFQQRQPSTAYGGGQVLPSTLHVATSPASALAAGTTSYLTGQQQQQQQQQRPSTMTYNVCYSNTPSSATSSFVAAAQHVHHPMPAADSDQLPAQASVFPTQETSGFGSPQITQHQQPQHQQQAQHWSAPGFQ